VKTRLIRPAAIALLVVAVTLPIGAADSAKSLFKKAKDAEARQNYEAAYDLYKQAYEQKPTDLAYRASYERTRFLAAASHVHRGQLLRDAGKLQEALTEFQKAAEIDSSSFIAQQEIRRTQKMINDAGNAPPTSAAPPPTGLQKRVQEAQGPVDLAAISNVPITLKMTEDTKIIYETIGKLAGLNVLFDPDYTSRRVKIELNGVSEQEALEIVALESKTFWRPVTPNTIFVASDNPPSARKLNRASSRLSTWRTCRNPPNCRTWSTRCVRSSRFPAFSPCLRSARWWCAAPRTRLHWRKNWLAIWTRRVRK
jgi:general secretion pathway protein D